jgi:hypothetical protein
MGDKKTTDVSKGNPNIGYIGLLQNNLDEDDIFNLAKFKEVPITEDAETTPLVITGVPENSKILNVHVICTVTNTNGTLKLRTNAGSPVDITDAIVCATDKAVTYAGTIDDAEMLVSSDGLQVIAGGDDGTLTRGILVISYR